MSNYYEYEDVKIAMYHALQKKEGWKLYGYKADESDMMTDYYSPASWGGIGVKNGYILCVNVYGEEKERIIKRYTETKTNNEEINQKIKKLSQITVERGASEAEAETALKMIETLKTKIVENIENYEVAEIIPAHQANPSRCNWHIEKDGVIIEKGSGLLKFSKLENYFIYPQYKEELEKFEKYENQKDEWISLEIERLENSYYSSDLVEIAERNWEKMSNVLKLYRQFQNLINKIDCACGSTIGEGYTYEKKIVTEYKTENKVCIDETGEKKQGQCFVLNTNFNYGCRKGFVYQIQEIKYNDGKIGYCAYKMNGKLTKICTGSATRSNYWYIGSGEHDNLLKYIEKGYISWCHIEQVKTPYEVEKIVNTNKKKETQKAQQPQTEEKETLGNYTVEKSKHTKTGETIYIVKPMEKLSKEQYQEEKKKMVENGGYYSIFVHGFIFKKFPSFLNTAAKEEKQEQKEEFAKIEKPSFESFKPFEVPEEPKEPKEQTDKQNKPDFETYKNIDFSKFEELEQEEKQEEKKKPIFEITNENEKFYVKLKKTFENLQDIKRKISTIGGFYSSNRNCFIFRENPAEKLKEITV